MFSWGTFQGIFETKIFLKKKEKKKAALRLGVSLLV
jgi:hypothetical protein